MLLVYGMLCCAGGHIAQHSMGCLLVYAMLCCAGGHGRAARLLPAAAADGQVGAAGHNPSALPVVMDPLEGRFDGSWRYVSSWAMCRLLDMVERRVSQETLLVETMDVKPI